ncbi:hypothetical protein JMUB7531_28870 [Staphylococcus aureus]
MSRGLGDVYKRQVKRTGIEFTSHMLRHTHATQLIREGWDVAFVQKRLGHAHVQTTLNTYVHLSDQDMKNEFNKYLERKEHKYLILLVLSLIHISEPTRHAQIAYAVFCLKKY